MKRIGLRYQRTIQRPARVQGIGFVTGAEVRLWFRPAPAGTGVVFVRTDLKDRPEVAARAGNVTGTARRTILGQAPNQVELVEHVLAALAGLRIDNCLVELDAPEPPGLDGSAHAFVEALCEAGIVMQGARREIWACEQPLSVCDGGATLTLYPEPTACLRVSYLLDYGDRSPLGLQRHTRDITPEYFCNGIGDARTFLVREEAEAFRQQGLGSRTKWSDLLVFDRGGPIGNTLRHADEPARHKILDIVGDFALFGYDLRGHLVGYRSGHTLNVRLVRRLLEEMPGGETTLRRVAA